MARNKRDKSEVSGLLDEIDALIEDFDKQRNKSSDLFREIEGYGGQSAPQFEASKHVARVREGIVGHAKKARKNAVRASSALRSVVSSVIGKTKQRAKVSIPNPRTLEKKRIPNFSHHARRAISAAKSAGVSTWKGAASKIPNRKHITAHFEKVKERLVPKPESLAPSRPRFQISMPAIPILSRLRMDVVLHELQGMMRYKVDKERSQQAVPFNRIALPIAVVLLVVASIFFIMNSGKDTPTGFSVASLPKARSVQEVVVGPLPGQEVGVHSSSCIGVACTTPPNAQCYISPGVCTAGTCSYEPYPAGRECDDGRGCTTLDSCDIFGECRGTTYCPDSCRGGTWLTAGSCQETGECSYIEIMCEHGCEEGRCVIPGTTTPTTTEDAEESTQSESPVGYYADYYDNINLIGHPVLSRVDTAINFQWQDAAPHPLVGVDTFSARWSRNITFEQARYRFTVRADDGVRVFIDGQLIPELDHWQNQPATTYTAERDMSAGIHEVVVEYFDNEFYATILFDYVNIVNQPPQNPPPSNPTNPPPAATPPTSPPTSTPPPPSAPSSQMLSLSGEQIQINGQLANAGTPIAGSVVTIRVANGIFDTRTNRNFFDDYASSSQGKVWGSNNAVYGAWNADANTNRLIAALPSYKAHGITAISVNMQGGCSCSRNGEDGMVLSGVSQTPDNNPYLKDGNGNLYIDPPYLNRLERLINAANQQGMIVFVGVLYFGQEHRLPSDADRLKAAELLATWILDKGFTNVVIETKNENQGSQALAMIDRVKQVASSRGKTLYATTSLGFKEMPSDQYLSKVDFVLIHTNGYPADNAGDGYSVKQVIDSIRARSAYQAHRTPILITEDGPTFVLANLNAATEKGVGWGYYNDREKQSVPANFDLFSASDNSFANRVQQIVS